MFYFVVMLKNIKQLFSLGEWAIKSSFLENLASSGFDEEFFKPSGEVDHKNRYDIDENGIAVLHIDGALGYRSNVWTAWLGIDTYNSIGAAFDKLLADESVNGIVLSIHSPGGLVSGVDDLAQKIFNARGSKPAGIVAHSAGMMCSAAYWIASACEKVYASSIAEVGSIGALARFSGSDKSNEVLVVRSTLSQNKALDPKTPRGMLAVEAELDAMAKAFITKVAKFRGSDFDTVLENTEQGKVFVGENAVKVGLVDEILSLDEVISQQTKQKEALMADKNIPGAPTATPEVDLDAVKASAVAEERSRILGIQEAFEGLALDSDCKKFVEEGKSVAEAERFCYSALKKQNAELKASAAASTHASAAQATAPAADAQATAVDPTADLTAQQQALVKQGLAANAGAANSIVAGQNNKNAEEDAELAAFEAGFNAH